MYLLKWPALLDGFSSVVAADALLRSWNSATLALDVLPEVTRRQLPPLSIVSSVEGELSISIPRWGLEPQPWPEEEQDAYCRRAVVSWSSHAHWQMQELTRFEVHFHVWYCKQQRAAPALPALPTARRCRLDAAR